MSDRLDVVPDGTVHYVSLEDGTPYAYVLVRQDITGPDKEIDDGISLAFAVKTLIPCDEYGLVAREAVYTVPVERLHHFLTDERWQYTSERIVNVERRVLACGKTQKQMKLPCNGRSLLVNSPGVDTPEVMWPVRQ